MQQRMKKIVCAAAIAALALGGCSTSAKSGKENGGKVEAVASFYPLAYVTSQVGGDAGGCPNLPIGIPSRR